MTHALAKREKTVSARRPAGFRVHARLAGTSAMSSVGCWFGEPNPPAVSESAYQNRVPLNYQTENEDLQHARYVTG
jgi:hypothetical protein